MSEFSAAWFCSCRYSTALGVPDVTAGCGGESGAIVRPLPKVSAAVFSLRRYSADYSPNSSQPAKLQKKMHICKSSRRKIARKCIFSAGVPAYARITAGATALKKVIASAIFFCGNTCLNAQHCCTIISEGPFRGVPKLQKKSDICKFFRKIYDFAPHFSIPFFFPSLSFHAPFSLPSRPVPIPFPFRFRFVIEPLPHDNRNISVR